MRAQAHAMIAYVGRQALDIALQRRDVNLNEWSGRSLSHAEGEYIDVTLASKSRGDEEGLLTE